MDMQEIFFGAGRKLFKRLLENYLRARQGFILGSDRKSFFSVNSMYIEAHSKMFSGLDIIIFWADI